MTGAPRPGRTPKALAEQQARLEREAAALRENLRRRKAVLRARASMAPTEGSSGQPEEKDEPTAA